MPKLNLQPFNEWDVDFVGPINPPRNRTGVRYIVIATNYLTRWAEVAPVIDCTAATAAIFLFENIVTRFGCPRILMSDQSNHFIIHTVRVLTKKL